MSGKSNRRTAAIEGWRGPLARRSIAGVVAADFHQQLVEFLGLLPGRVDAGLQALLILFSDMRQEFFRPLGALFEGGDVLLEMFDQLFDGGWHGGFSGGGVRPRVAG